MQGADDNKSVHNDICRRPGTFKLTSYIGNQFKVSSNFIVKSMCVIRVLYVNNLCKACSMISESTESSRRSERFECMLYIGNQLKVLIKFSHRSMYETKSVSGQCMRPEGYHSWRSNARCAP